MVLSEANRPQLRGRCPNLVLHLRFVLVLPFFVSRFSIFFCLQFNAFVFSPKIHDIRVQLPMTTLHIMRPANSGDTEKIQGVRRPGDGHNA